MAICHKNLDTAKLLVSRGAYAMRGANGGYTALHQLAYGGHLELLQDILDGNRAVNINVADERGLTLLYHAAVLHREPVVSFPVDRGTTATPA